jgi:hypothetical protein
MTKEQRQGYKTNGYYDNGCYNIARDVFTRLYRKGERNGKVIKEAVLLEMTNYCKAQGWNLAVSSYHIQRYGMKSLMYWFTRYAGTLKP